MTEKVSRFKSGSSAHDKPSWLALRPRDQPPDGPQTLPGRLAESAAKSLQEQIDALRAEREAGLIAVRFDPKRVRATKFINRDERSFLESDAAFVALKESLRQNGQEQPGRVRPITGDPHVDAEVVSGHRRHRAALLLDTEIDGGFPFFALVDSQAADSRNLVLKMYRENEERVDLSPFEKGCMFLQWLDAELFSSQREIASAVNLGESAVAKYVAVGSLPSAVLAAFGDPRAIPMSWGASLSQALKLNEAAVLKAAERLIQKQPLPTPEVVFRALLAVSANKQRATRSGTSREESVRIGGKIPLKVGVGRDRIVLKLFHLDSATQKELREELKDWAEAWLRKKLDET